MKKCICKSHVDKNNKEIKKGQLIKHELQGIGSPIEVMLIEGILVGKDKGNRMMPIHNFLPTLIEIIKDKTYYENPELLNI